MRRIISILMIARLIQRLMRGSRRPGPRGHRRFDEPRQGSGRFDQARGSGNGNPGSNRREPIEGSVTRRDSERND